MPLVPRMCRHIEAHYPELDDSQENRKGDASTIESEAKNGGGKDPQQKQLRERDHRVGQQNNISLIRPIIAPIGAVNTIGWSRLTRILALPVINSMPV